MLCWERGVPCRASAFAGAADARMLACSLLISRAASSSAPADRQAPQKCCVESHQQLASSYRIARCRADRCSSAEQHPFSPCK